MVDSKQHVFVTGGASGIGESIVESFLNHGARVAIFDNNVSAMSEKKGILASVDHLLTGDVCDPEAVDQAFTTLDKDWGKIDVVINNAGISVPASLLDTTLEIWNKVLSVNLTGVFLVSKRATTSMLKQKAGMIINIASVSGMVGMPNYLSYNVSKAGVIALSKTLAIELAPVIRVNAICPGYVLTPMQEQEYSEEQLRALAEKVPTKRLASPSEIASLAVYLSSEAADFINGSSIVIDGGETAGGLASV